LKGGEKKEKRLTGARRGYPHDTTAPGKDLWTDIGVQALIRKIAADPGLSEELRKEALLSVYQGAIEKGIMKANELPSTRATTFNAEKAPVEFDEYQTFTDTVALFPEDSAIAYTISGLCGEVGELAGKMHLAIEKTIKKSKLDEDDERLVNLKLLSQILSDFSELGADAEKLKKGIRNGETPIVPITTITQTESVEIKKELSDVCWYFAQFAKSLGAKLSDITKINIEKLLSRKERGVIKGSGDNR